MENEEILFKIVHHSKKKPIEGIAEMEITHNMFSLIDNCPNKRNVAIVFNNEVMFTIWKEFMNKPNSYADAWRK